MVMVLLLRRMEMHPTPRLHRKSKGSQYPRHAPIPNMSRPLDSRSRNLAGNLDSPQTFVFITSIIDEIAGVST